MKNYLVNGSSKYTRFLCRIMRSTNLKNRNRKIWQTFIGFMVVVLFHSCSVVKEEPVSFVGGPENPASDGSYTKAIICENGIASLEEIELGGVNQWLLIRGHDLSNPLIIFLHGGPGATLISYAVYSMENLEKDFTVVSWDQRGCGKSFDLNLDPASITANQLYQDSHELVLKMLSRFNKDKVFLIGHSWGTYLGTHLAKEYPDLFHAYIGIGQLVELRRSFEIKLEFGLEKALELGIQEAISDFSSISKNDITIENNSIMNDWINQWGYGDFRDVSFFEQWENMKISCTEYIDEDVGYRHLWSQLYSNLKTDLDFWIQIDFIKQVPEILVPVFFISGIHDYKTPYELVEEYYHKLKAPMGKNIILFEDMAHSPNIMDRERFAEELSNIKETILK